MPCHRELGPAGRAYGAPSGFVSNLKTFLRLCCSVSLTMTNNANKLSLAYCYYLRHSHFTASLIQPIDKLTGFHCHVRSTQTGHLFIDKRNEYQSNGDDALWLGSKGRYGSLGQVKSSQVAFSEPVSIVCRWLVKLCFTSHHI